MRLIFYLSLLLSCRSALLASYKLAKSGGDLYDFTGNGYNAVVSRNGGLPYIITDRGYYIQDKTTIQFPFNSYKSSPAQPRMLLGIWHFIINPGIFVSFSLKHGGNLSLLQFKWLKEGTNIKLELLKDGAMVDNAINLNVNYGIWRFSIISIYENLGNVHLEYYRMPNRNFEKSYIIPSLSLQDSYVSWSINSVLRGISGFIYEVYWYDDTYSRSSTIFDAIVLHTDPANPCYFRPFGGVCLSTSLDPFSYITGTSCNVCSETIGSCYTSLSGCSSPTCILGSTPECLCMNYCSECNKDTVNVLACSKCDSKYSTQINTCNKCPNDCSVCLSATICTTCRDGYYLSTSNCLACESNCKTCLNITTCTACNGGFYLSNSDCFACEINCKTCSNDTVCTQCNEGYYIANSDCFICKATCTTCISSSVCTACRSGYYLKLGDCVVNCGDRYYLSSSDCLACESNCKMCSSDTICTLCNAGYYLNNQDCVTSCGDAYYLDTFKCNPCSTNCIKCTSDSICLECITNFYLKSQECVPDCGDGFYSNSGICIPCSINCRSCIDSYICTSCISPYYLKGESCVLDCGLEYYPEFNICRECKTGCSICSNNTDCILCKNGYVLEDNTCIRCERRYILEGECVNECGDGYYIQDRVCYRCIDNCRTCSEIKCEECYSGYYIEEGTCVNECRQGYGINENRCEECQEGSLVVNGVCQICELGYYPDENTCEKCPILCRECIDDFTCTECMNYSSLIDGLCECNENFILYESMCVRGIITPNATLTSNNTIEFGFNIPLDFSLSKDHLSLSLNSNIITSSSYSLSEVSPNQSYYIIFISPISTNSTIIITFTTTFKYLTLDYFLSADFVSLLINFSLSNSNSSYQSSQEYLYQNPRAAKLQDQTRTTTRSISSTVLSFAVTGSTSVWCFINTLQLLSIIPLINVDLPEYLFALLTGSRNYIPIPNPFGYFVPNEGPNSFYRASLLGYSRTEFVYNTGEIFSGILAIMLIYPILIYIKKLARAKYSNKYLFKLLESYISNYKWNVFLRFLLESYLEITLSAFIQLYEYNSFLSPSANKLVNFSICIMFLIMIFLFPIFLYYRLSNISKLHDPNFSSRFGSLYEELNIDKNEYSRYYYLYFILHRGILLIVLCFMGSIPIIQIILCSILCWAKTWYLIQYRPFKERSENLLYGAVEVCVSISYSTILFLVLNIEESEADIVQYVVIAACAIGMGMSLGFFVFQVLGMIIRIIKRYRIRKIEQHTRVIQSNNSKADTIHTESQIQTPVKISESNDIFNIRIAYNMLNETKSEI